jgi:hypothetical protein
LRRQNCSLLSTQISCRLDRFPSVALNVPLPKQLFTSRWRILVMTCRELTNHSRQIRCVTSTQISDQEEWAKLGDGSRPILVLC